MKNCLFCGEMMTGDLTWATIFMTKEDNALCKTCLDAFEKIQGQQCQKCSRPTDQSLCQDCFYWQNFYKGKDFLTFNQSIYSYNTFMQDFMTQWKYRGDYCLGEVFQEEIYRFFQKALFKQLPRNIHVLPIPLSQQRLETRAFNQAAQLADFLPLPQKDVLVRAKSEKQSKKGRYERLQTQNPFQAKSKIENPILLVDDIYTTGRTLRHAAEALIEKECPSVFAFTLIRS